MTEMTSREFFPSLEINSLSPEDAYISKHRLWSIITLFMSTLIGMSYLSLLGEDDIISESPLN